MNIQNFKSIATKSFGRGTLIARKYSPEILMAVGIAGMVTSTVMACKATLKVDQVKKTSEYKLTKIKRAHDELDKETYSEKDYQKDLVIAYTQTSMDYIKLYGPAVSIGVGSILCVLGAHNIMRKRNLALVAAYKMVEQGFNSYRERVIEEFGSDKDRQFKYGIKQETVVENETDENGKTKKVKKIVETVDPNKHSIYAKFFDEASPNWCKTPEYNLIFLKCQQQYANDLLHARGHVFLNEVYESLGIPHTQAGAVMGWVLGEGDNYIDFGIYDLDSSRGRAFVNGDERSILLDFNVDGVIYDLI